MDTDLDLGQHSAPAAAQPSEAAAPVQPPVGTLQIDAAGVERMLMRCYELEASDLHITVGRPPVLRVSGNFMDIEGFPILNDKDTDYVFAYLLESVNKERYLPPFEQRQGTDFGYAFRDVCRFRVSVYKQRGHTTLALRLIPYKILTFEQLGLPENVKELLHRPRGLVLVTGPTGCGKTTTLATMIDYINRHRHAHIITIEDPIEYYHPHRLGLMHQREVGIDVPTFLESIVRNLRSDPDVILVGEMRDVVTMQAAITAAETGHLVFSTLHTVNAEKTLDRLVGSFPEPEQPQIRVQVSTSLVSVISQQLMPRIDKPGRVASFEILVNTPAVAHLIRKDDTPGIHSAMQTGKMHGMMTMDEFLFNLFKAGKISEEEMMLRCFHRSEIEKKLSELREETSTRA
jgi:twitching motility protein PilT